MPSYKNFQSKNAKHKNDRFDVNEPAFNPAVEARGIQESTNFERNLNKYIDFVSWARWNPDLWWDLITPETGGIRLDMDQRVFFRSLARFISTYGVFPRGYGKCQSGDTLLFTNEGIKELGEFFNFASHGKEFYISSNINLVNRHGQLESTNAGVYSGYQPTKKIITEEGYEVENSLNHPLLVMNKRGCLEWKISEDIEIGDYLAINRNNDVWGNKTDLNIDMDSYLNDFSNSSRWKVERKKCNIIKNLDEEFGLILGYLIGDGCITRNYSICFTNTDEDIVENYKNFMENRLGVVVKPKKDYPIDYLINSRFVREYFKQIGLEVADSFNKEVPKCVLNAPKKVVASFIKGLFDTDGGLSNTYIEYCTASKKLSKQIQTILLNFGIMSTRKKRYNKQYKTSHYKIMIYGKNMDLYLKHIGFSCKRKQVKLVKLCEKKRNPNKDVIPYQKELINEFCASIKHKTSYNYRIRDKVYHVLKGDNQLTYEKLKYLISLDDSSECKGYEELVEFFNLNYFFSKVSDIKNSNNHVYDLSVPNSNSFISNGFVSHNTLLEVMGMYHTAIFFPDIELSMTAQTKENAAKLVNEKHREIIKFYPLISNEITSYRYSKDTIEANFTSGGRIDTLANNQSSKGQRRKRLNVEEAAQLNAALFDDVLEPVVNVPRRTIGKQALVNPEELNGQINFFTTSWFRGSDEYERNIEMVKDMAELKGKIVIGSDWQLACSYGRGETKSQILDKKARLSPTFFAMNYQSRWVGATDGALIDMNKVMDLRTLVKPELKGDGKSEYIVSMDVARSESQNNNQSCIVVFKLKRNKNEKITQIKIVNLINLPNGLNFTAQTVELKRIKNMYNAKAVVVDGNGLGSAIVDEALKETTDPLTGDSLGCWNTINNEREPELEGAEKILYDLHAQGINSDIIINFIDMIESKKLQLLEKRQDSGYDVSDADYFKNNVLPHLQTDFLLEEIANLKMKKLPSGKYTVERVTKKIDKDRYSALAYGLWYIKQFEDKNTKKDKKKLIFLYN
ncbi:LAGLIDADG family homing endonuclease [Chengkuizengella marina]|nr:LAGLIDADG family homing endonuclease [Chengkuizengella marina]